MFRLLAKTSAVIVSSTLLATLTVNAIDMRGYMPDTLLALLFGVSTQVPEAQACPVGMVLVTQALTPFCVDVYEASPGAECPFSEPRANTETSLNVADEQCKAVSVPHTLPWRHITQVEAQKACSRSGKRLLRPDEWYKAALGTPDNSTNFTEEGCNVARNRADGAAKTGTGMRCVSDTGAYDMVGNVWEWVDGVVDKGVYETVVVPPGGYVIAADLNGMAYTTGATQDERFGNDRFWMDGGIRAGVMRGGYYDNASQAGIFATYAASEPTFTGEAVGFRCALTSVSSR
jgi:formylglycine-generating enzyme required for sulfatase activity